MLVFSQPGRNRWPDTETDHESSHTCCRFTFRISFSPATFEHTIDYLVDNERDLSVFDERYINDEVGAPAYDPAVLLKVVLFAYSRGITSSWRIARACEENVVFMALSADSRPHFTTIAEFISSMSEQIGSVFTDQAKRLKLLEKENERLSREGMGTGP